MYLKDLGYQSLTDQGLEELDPRETVLSPNRLAVQELPNVANPRILHHSTSAGNVAKATHDKDRFLEVQSR